MLLATDPSLSTCKGVYVCVHTRVCVFVCVLICLCVSVSWGGCAHEGSEMSN